MPRSEEEKTNTCEPDINQVAQYIQQPSTLNHTRWNIQQGQCRQPGQPRAPPDPLMTVEMTVETARSNDTSKPIEVIVVELQKDK